MDVAAIAGRTIAVLVGPGTGRDPKNPTAAPKSGSVLVTAM